MSIILNKQDFKSTFVSQQSSHRPSFLPSTFRPFGIGLILTFSFLISACGLDVEDPIPPLPPVWIEKSLPEDWPERGIDAHETGGIFLEWEQNLNEDIAVYNIYRGLWQTGNDSLGDYELIMRLEPGSISIQEFIDLQAEKHNFYSYKLQSEDGAGNLSNYSDSLTYSLLPPILVDAMVPNGQLDTLANNRRLSWQNYYLIEAEDYCITLLTLSNNFLIREVVQPKNYFGGVESWDIPASVILEFDSMYKWRVDTQGRYVDEHETAASESPWVSFLYLGE